MTEAERKALVLIGDAHAVIANPMTVASLGAISLPEARDALDALKKAGLIDWQPATRGARGTVLVDATWTLTAEGREALAEG